jgi:hypothetical protein
MSLHLVSMFIYTPEEVSTTMHIQHNSAAPITVLLACVVVSSHFNPFGLEFCSFLSPLPPFASPNLVDAFVAELLN